MQSVGRLWLANIARGAWSGERASGGRMGVFGMGESSHPISGAIERGEIHAARPANLIRPIAIEKVKGDE